MLHPFSIARLPRIEFGCGVLDTLPALIRRYGKQALFVTGGQSFIQTRHWTRLQQALSSKQIHWQHCAVKGEPSPMLVDETVASFRASDIDVVVGIGGGSALDAAKAVAGLLRVGDSVTDYLEGVGPERTYTGPVVPFIAIPTTAGTGSEATKNAVLSLPGEHGYKKSFRDEQLVAEYAVVDPDLLTGCPAALIAANGMDALTQLMESYVSLKANRFTDALAIDGLKAVRDSLPVWYRQTQQAEAETRAKMAYAALLSGITLAQCGLGSVHGLASPLGAFYPIPHGVVCGTLVAEATAMNIQSMREREAGNPALPKYAHLAEILCQQTFTQQEAAWDALVGLLHDWTTQMQLPCLGQYGLDETGLDHVVAHSRGSSMKTNPIVLTDDEIKEILQRRL